MGETTPVEVSGKEYEEELYGFIKIVVDGGRLKAYAQWVFKAITDYTTGEDIVMLLPEDAQYVEETLKDICIIDAVVNERAIVMFVKAKI